MKHFDSIYDKARHFIPGGVNSPVRAFQGVGGSPVFFQGGEGAYLTAVDGKRYIDYVGSWGPLILGHAHPAVIQAVEKTLKKGLSFGAPTPLEVELAELICDLVPSIEMVRMVNSGTEAVMSAIRLARAYTRRNKIVKFAGNYHGHADALLVKSGSGALTLGVPNSAGVPEDFTKHTLVAEYNDIENIKHIFAEYGDDIAAIIVEPVACNMNCVLPKPGFLQALRQICTQHHSLLIFDEVITGFRLGLGGAQSYYQVTPDLTTLGKIIGGGMPVGAFGGKREIMEFMAPLGPVYQAGTLSGNPVAMSAGLATLKELMHAGVYDALRKQTQKFTQGLQNIADAYSVPVRINQIESLFGIFFTEAEIIETYQQVTQCHIASFKKFFHEMLDKTIYMAPSAFEAGFLSIAHQDREIDITLDAAEKSFKTLASLVN